jgi:xanthine/uracil/vitamin C permease (AzgA family)
MPSPVRHPVLAVVGLVVIAVLCIQLLRGAVTLEAAAWRALSTVAVLAVVDRIAVPVGRALLTAGTHPAAPAGELDPVADDPDRRVP